MLRLAEPFMVRLEVMEGMMNFRTLMTAAVLGLALSGTGYAACDVTQTGLNVYPSWPKEGSTATTADKATPSPADNQAAKAPAQRADAQRTSATPASGACN